MHLGAAVGVVVAAAAAASAVYGSNSQTSLYLPACIHMYRSVQQWLAIVCVSIFRVVQTVIVRVCVSGLCTGKCTENPDS